jgi:hypothetical protein
MRRISFVRKVLNLGTTSSVSQLPVKEHASVIGHFTIKYFKIDKHEIIRLATGTGWIKNLHGNAPENKS